MMTMQEVFDKSVGGVLKQGRLATTPVEEKCVYRLNVGDKTYACAIGQLIRDEDYDERVEGRGLFAQLRTPGRDGLLLRMLKNGGVNVGEPKMDELLTKLQSAHDNASTLEEFKRAAIKVGKTFNLDTMEIRCLP